MLAVAGLYAQDRQKYSPDQAKDKAAEKVVQITDHERQLGGEWLIDSIYNNEVYATAENYSNFYFDFSHKMFICNNACNTINGTFNINTKEPNMVSFIVNGFTDNTCALANKVILKAVEQAHRFTLVSNGDEDRLFIYDQHNRPAIIMTRNNIKNLSGIWEVKELYGENYHEADSLIFIADTELLRVTCKTGKNYINGKIFIDHSKKHSIQFEELKALINKDEITDSYYEYKNELEAKEATYNSFETKMLLALEDAMQYQRINDNEFYLLDNDGNKVMRIKKVPPRRIKK